jgi:Glyoxalase-like domain
MATHVQVVIDCADPAKLAEFWAQALRYKLQDPPEGFESWEDFLRANNVPESEWNSASAVVDPDGAGPRVFFQRVPEPKTVKNRVHLDLNVGGGLQTPIETRKERIAEEAVRLEGLGASQLRTVDEPLGYCVVMQDPEGNEFCLQ